jgi:hypothetical protein
LVPFHNVELSNSSIPAVLTAMPRTKSPELDPLDYDTARRLADEIAKIVGKFVLVTDKHGRAVYEAEPHAGISLSP